MRQQLLGLEGAVTAYTITDKQIRELRELGSTPLTGNGFEGTCDIALGVKRFNDIGRIQAVRQARGRCAEIWNARHPAGA